MDSRLEPRPIVDLTNCDLEPIHVPGAVQPHTALLAGEIGAESITHVSESAVRLFGLSAGEILGRPFREIVGRPLMHEAANAELISESPNRPGMMFGVAVENLADPFDVFVHSHDGRRILELEAHSARSGLDRAEPLSMLESLAPSLQAAAGEQALLDSAVDSLRSLLGFDRVMIYRFASDDSGEVVAEARRSHLEPYLGLRYPASDIPKQARTLYLQNLSRLIADVEAEPAPIFALAGHDDRPLDLSFAAGRAVSPIHIEYLRNMGVGASMSISIIVEGRLWGLVACHHGAAKMVPAPRRMSAQVFAQLLSVQLEAALREQSFSRIHAARDKIESVVRSVPAAGSLFRNLADQAQELRRVIAADGAAVAIDGELETDGIAPPLEQIPPLIDFIARQQEGVYRTDSLHREFPAAEGYRESASGVVALPLSKAKRNYILFFRREFPQTVSWAGNPDKPVTSGPMGDRLTPRKSFDVWKEERLGEAAPWSPSDLMMVEALRIALIEVALGKRETLAAERLRSEKRQKVLISELNHRVKNILALMNALVSRSRTNAESVEAYVHTLQGRIRALAVAHDHMTHSARATLRSLFKSEGAAFVGEQQQLRLDGPPVALDSKAFPILALIVHEMMTNASKYGALSADHGAIDVRWSWTPKGALHMQWTESGGPPVEQPDREGFGSVLLRRNVPFELGGKSEILFEPTGLRAIFIIPAAHVQEVEEELGVPAAASPRPVSGSLEGQRILVVEDQMMIALNTQEMLEDLGAEIVETASGPDEAVQAISDGDFLIAVLDVNLGSATSLGVAAELRRLGIPFVFATGYSDSSMIPEEFRDVPIVRKPYGREALLDALLRVLDDRPRPASG